MGHLIVLVNLLTLFAGLVLAGVLFRRWRVDRRPWPFWQFLHFSGFTFTMVVVTLDAYAVVNLGMGSDLIRLWSSAVLAGTSLMLFSFPHLSRAEAGRPPSGRFSLFWAAWSLVPMGVAVWLPWIQDYGFLLFLLSVAFLPFMASIVYGLAVGTRAAVKTPWNAWVVFLALILVGAAEVWWVNSYPPLGGYFFITLPLAYLYTLWTTWRTRSPVAFRLDPSGIPAALADGLKLSPRERDVAGGILKGLSNKELAFQLGLSEHTVRNHIAHLYRKLKIQKRLDLVLLVQKYQAG